MKHLRFMLFFLCLGFGFHAYSQVTVSLGTRSGAGSSNVLLTTSTTSNKYSRTMSLYTASEILTAGGVAGTISSLGWTKEGTGEYLSNDAYIKVYLKHINISAWSTSPVPVWDTEIVGATEVFTSSTYSIPTGIGWKTVTFSSPFVWNGIDGIVVCVEFYRASAPTTDISWARSTNANANATRVGSTSLAALIMLVNSNRPLLQLTITPGASVPVTGVTVTTQGSIPAVITAAAGTLQMNAAVIPAGAGQTVNWSLVNGTGSASISATGLVTAQSNGTVWAKATSVQDITKMDSLQITISNQPIPITSLVVSTQGSVPAAITTLAGTLQMNATIIPVGASQSINWSIINGTGSASISAMGLVTAQSNGTVWAKAVSVQDITKMDSLQITISNQPIPITSLVVSTQGSVPAAITTLAGALQMNATIIPVGASQAINWSIINGTGSASISAMGLVTAQSNGTVWAKAVSVQDITKMDSLQITISNQLISITSLNVSTQGGAPATITTKGGTLQLVASILPSTANQSVTWSIIPLTGSASIDATGLVTAQTNGSLWARAISVLDNTKKDSIPITISNQDVGIGASDDFYRFMVYPNPVTAGVINIALPFDPQELDARIEILDVLGRVVRTEIVDRAILSISLDKLTAGIYVIRFINQNEQMSRKFLLE